MPYVSRKAGSFYLRLAIPRSLQTTFKKTEVCYPLHVSNALQAKAVALSLASQLLQYFGELQQMTKQANEPSISSILSKLENGEATQYEVTLPNGTKITANGKEDHEMALQSIGQLEKAGAFVQPAQAKPASVMSPKQVLQNYMGIKRIKLVKAISDFIELKIKEKNKSITHIKNSLGHFESWSISRYDSNVNAHQLNSDDLAEYRIVLENLDTNLSRQDNNKLAISTVLSRLNYIENFFRYCQGKFYYPDGDRHLPTFNNKPDKYDAVEGETSYSAFTEDELKKIFNPLHYKVLLDEPHKFWAPLIGIFMGARRGELVALRLHNINNHNPEKIWTIYFTEKIKNKNSRRFVPIHQSLLDAGFLDYVEDVREIYGSESILFPYSKNPGKMLGDCFARYLDRLNITDKRKVYHSFRKNIAISTITCFERYVEHYIGHLPFTVHNHIYSGREYPFGFYKKQMEAIYYQYLDFSRIKYDKGHFLPYLKREEIVLARNSRKGIKMPEHMKGPRTKKNG